MFDKTLADELDRIIEIIDENFDEKDLNSDKAREKLDAFFGHPKNYYVAIVNPLRLQIYYFCKPAIGYLGFEKMDFKKANLSFITKFLAKENMGIVYTGVQHFLSKKDRFNALTLSCKVKRHDNAWRDICFSSKLLHPGDDEKGFVTVSLIIDVQDYLKQTLENNHSNQQNESYQLSAKKLLRINQLTIREKELLILFCNEKKNHEIAEELIISEHTVRAHKRTMMKKLDTKSPYTLAKYALYLISNPDLMNGGKVGD